MDSIRPRNLSDYLEALQRHKLLIILPTLIVAVASAIAIKQLANFYESSTFIIVESPQGETSIEQRSLDLSRRLSTIHQQVTSRTRLEEIIQKYGLYEDQLQRGVRLDDVIASMRQDVRVDVSSSRDNATDAFSISYRTTDAYKAQAVTTELANQLILENVEAMKAQAAGEADVLRQRAVEISSQLKDLEEKDPWLVSLKEDSPLAPPAATGPAGPSGPSPDAVRSQQMTIENLKDQQYRLQQQLADVERRIAAQRQLVEQQKKSGSSTTNPAIGALLAKKAELQGQRETLINRQEYTDKHPRVLALNDQIAAIDRQIADLRQQDAGAVTQTAEVRELAALESERNRLLTDLEVSNRAFDRQLSNPPVTATAPRTAAARGPVVPRDPGSARLAQDYLGLKQNYKDVLTKLQDAELRSQTAQNAKIEKFRVLDQANLPQLPVWPNRKLLFGLSTGAGILLGVLSAIFIEVRRFPTIQDGMDVDYYTKLPLLGAIPQTLTPAEKMAAQRRARLKYVLAAVLTVVITLALTKLLLASEVFALIGRK